jgi:protein-serine/threonine kinase
MNTNPNNVPPQQQQPPLTGQTQRLQLNFGFNNDRPGADGRQFPTTPSTFPQPVYPNQNGQQEVWGAQQSNTGYGTASYFMSNPYQQQYNPQTANLPGQYRSPPPQPGSAYNDGTNGLAQQFAHQNLGGNTPRSASPYARQASASPNTAAQNPQHQRPHTAGSSTQRAQFGNFLTPQMQQASSSPSMYDDEPPPKNPDKYSDNVVRKAKVSNGLVSTFFKDNVQRARDRNGR